MAASGFASRRISVRRSTADRSSSTIVAPYSVGPAGPDARLASRTRAMTSSPRSRSRRTTALPMNPAAPVMRTRIGSRLVDRRVRANRFEPGLDVPEEGGPARTIVRAVIDAEDHVHHGPDRDHVAVRRRDDDRALRDRLHRDDAHLGDVEDRHHEVRPQIAGVVDRERSPTEVVDPELVDAGSVGDVEDRHVQSVDRQLVGIADDRDDQPDRKSTRLNSSHRTISYAVFCLKKKKMQEEEDLSASIALIPLLSLS